MKLSHSTSLVGIALDTECMSVAHLRRNGDAPTLGRVFTTRLALDVLTAEPDLFGREVREHLVAAGIRERHCVVCLPVTWALSLCTSTPELSEADTRDFLALQAEREFLMSPAGLALGVSRFSSGIGPDSGATVAGIASVQLGRLRAAMRAAGLRVSAFTLGVSAAVSRLLAQRAACAVLLAGDQGVDVVVIGGGGVLAVRRLGSALATPEGAPDVDVDGVLKQLRITLAQLPPAMAEAASTVRIWGRPDIVRLLSHGLEHLPAMPVTIDLAPPDAGVRVSQDAPEFVHSPEELSAVAAAAAALRDDGLAIEFRPAAGSDPGRLWRARASHLALRAGIGAAVAVVFGVACLLFQHLRLRGLEHEWEAMRAPVAQVDATKSVVRRKAQWLRSEPDALSVMRLIARAFPEEGEVWATRLTIRGLREVSVTGKARSREAWLHMQQALRDMAGVVDLRMTQTRESLAGGEPMTFSLNFRWQPGARDVR